MWLISNSFTGSKALVTTADFARVWNVKGVTNSRALSVIITSTLAPSFLSLDTISHALYTAIPPLTPKTTFFPYSIITSLSDK